MTETPERLKALAQELVDRYTRQSPVSERHNGCGWCGGLPHSTECIVGRFEVVLRASVPAERSDDKQTPCPARTDIFGRCMLVQGHQGRHVNSLGEDFGMLASALRDRSQG